MKAIYILTLASAYFSIDQTEAPADCICPEHYMLPGFCASDGEIYHNQCQAQCGRPDLKILFNCSDQFTSEQEKECAQKCQISAEDCRQNGSCKQRENPKLACESDCPLYFKFNRMCASNGKTYMDLCRGRCEDKSLTELFNCSQLSILDCDTKCKEKFDKSRCKAKCGVKKRAKKICASDGKLYPNECLAQCSNSNLIEVFKCSTSNDKKCKKECAPMSEISRCQNECPVSEDEQRNFCFTSGKVYQSDCHANCVDKNIEFYFDCADKNISLSDKVKCENLCMKEIFCFKTCEKMPNKYVCASDGKVYKNKCEAQCKGLDILFFMKWKNEHEETKCKDAVSFVGAARK